MDTFPQAPSARRGEQAAVWTQGRGGRCDRVGGWGGGIFRTRTRQPHLSWGPLSPRLPGAPAAPPPLPRCGWPALSLSSPAICTWPQEEPVLSRDTGSFLPSSSGEEVTLQKPLPQPDPRLNKPLPLIGPLAPSSPALARGPTAFPHVLSSLPSRQAANLLYRLHLCTWAPVAEGVGVTEPPARLLGQECAHHEACFGRETWPASYFSSGTAC